MTTKTLQRAVAPLLWLALVGAAAPAPTAAQRRQPRTVREFFELLPQKYFPLEGCEPDELRRNCPRARAAYLKTFLLVEDTANGYMKGDCDGAQSCFQMALFRRPDRTYVVGLTVSSGGEERSHFLEYAGGAWREVGRSVVPEFDADKVYELPRDGTTVDVYENSEVRGGGYRKRGRKLYELDWKGGRFAVRR